MRKAIWLIWQIVRWIPWAVWEGYQASIGSLWDALKVWPQKAEMLSETLTYRAISKDFMSRYALTLKRVLLVTSWAALIFGWISAAYLTLWLARAIINHISFR